MLLTVTGSYLGFLISNPLDSKAAGPRWERICHIRANSTHQILHNSKGEGKRGKEERNDNAANKWADDVAGENEGDAENAEEEAT